MKIDPRNNNRTSFSLLFFPFCLIVLLSLLACEATSPVRGLAISVDFQEKQLTDNLLTRVKVKYITTASFQAAEGDYRIFAVADWQGRILFREDLDPSVSFNRWQANRVYEVEKYLYFPEIIDRFDRQTASGVEVDFRLIMEKTGESSAITLYSRKLKLHPCPAELPKLIFLDGWLRVNKGQGRSLPSDADLWTGEKAICLLENPGREALLMLRGRCYVEGLRVSLMLDEEKLDEFILTCGEFQKIWPVPAIPQESFPELRLTISVDRVISLSQIYPELADNREAGLKIEKIYFR
ncbi:MAG: hypothetical protein WBI18_01520 [Candidatus Saccharicenans sp.]